MSAGTHRTAISPELQSIPGVKVKVSEPLTRYTSIKIGGPADYFFEVENASALRRVLALLRNEGLPFCVLGNGSNVLISDFGIRGAVIRLDGDFKRIDWKEEGETVWVEAGGAYPVTRLVRQAAQRGYGGLEFAEGIPGSIGGALIMNAGAYGSEFEKVVDQVKGVAQNGEPILLLRRDLMFTYRDSHVPCGTVVTGVRLRLRKEPPAQVGSRLRELIAKRKHSQPSGFPNSGSMFRNPPGDFAGRLIEAAGLKGKRIGQSQISERHANFIVNRGGAKAVEVRQLMELAQAEVKKQFGIDLEPEVRLLGEWKED